MRARKSTHRQLVAFAAIVRTLPSARRNRRQRRSAFEQGKRSAGPATPRPSGTISNTAQSTVPELHRQSPQASYFGSPGISAPQAAARASACASRPGCRRSRPATAVQFSQTNPSQRPSFNIAPTDPLLTPRSTITADPQAIAGNIAGTYSGCTPSRPSPRPTVSRRRSATSTARWRPSPATRC